MLVHVLDLIQDDVKDLLAEASSLDEDVEVEEAIADLREDAQAVRAFLVLVGNAEESIRWIDEEVMKIGG